jgi:hypothetical protein
MAAEVRPEAVRVVAAALLGAAAGVAAKAADEGPVGWLGDLDTYAAVWIFALALIARYAPSSRTAALRAAAFFLAMSLAYYAWAERVLGFGPGGASLALWATVSLTVVPAVAAALAWGFSRRGALAGAVVAAAAAVTVADGGVVWQVLWTHVLGAAPDGFRVRPVQAAAALTLGLAIALALPAHRRTRVWALALTPPLAWIAHAVVFDVVYGRVLFDLLYGRLGG